MRITGRLLRPSTLAERRLLMSLGSPWYRVPRSENPYLIARKLRRLARMGPALLGLPEATRAPRAA